jgi:hypothetical protein
MIKLVWTRGVTLNLINAQHVKGVPGRKKTDVEDCSWLQKLHIPIAIRKSLYLG